MRPQVLVGPTKGLRYSVSAASETKFGCLGLMLRRSNGMLRGGLLEGKQTTFKELGHRGFLIVTAEKPRYLRGTQD